MKTLVRFLLCAPNELVAAIKSIWVFFPPALGHFGVRGDELLHSLAAMPASESIAH
jgi:hypothetical protein